MGMGKSDKGGFLSWWNGTDRYYKYFIKPLKWDLPVWQYLMPNIADLAIRIVLVGFVGEEEK